MDPELSVGENLTSSLSSSSLSSTDHRDPFQFVVYGVIGGVVNGAGFIGNVLTLVVLFSMHPRTSVTLYIIGIAITDAVILGIGEIAIFLPRGLDNYFNINDPDVDLGVRNYVDAMKTTQFPWLYACSEIVIFTNTWYTVCLSVERYLAICKPFDSIYHSRLCSESKTKRVLLILFLLCFIINVPKFFEFETCHRWAFANGTYRCNPDMPVRRPLILPKFKNNAAFNPGYRVIWDNLVRLVIPVLILSILTWKTIRHLRRSGLRHQGNHEASLQVKVTIMCTAVVIVYLLCQVPYIAAIFIHTLYPTDSSRPRNTLIFNRSVSVAVLLIAVNSSLNFLIYCYLSPHFLRVFRAMFCRRCCPDTSHQDAFNELNHTTASSLSRMPSEAGDRDRIHRGRSSLQSLVGSSKRATPPRGTAIQMKDLQERLESAVVAADDNDNDDQANAKLTSFVLPEEEEDGDSGHSSSRDSSLRGAASRVDE